MQTVILVGRGWGIFLFYYIGVIRQNLTFRPKTGEWELWLGKYLIFAPQYKTGIISFFAAWWNLPVSCRRNEKARGYYVLFNLKCWVVWLRRRCYPLISGGILFYYLACFSFKNNFPPLNSDAMSFLETPRRPSLQLEKTVNSPAFWQKKKKTHPLFFY